MKTSTSIVSQSPPQTLSLRRRFQRVRVASEALCESLEPEDYVVQSMPDASPVKWHLAHTTWFFETFVLRPLKTNYHSPDPQFATLFNSYYNSIGHPFPRPRRGLLSRPTVAEVIEYRREVDLRMEAVFDRRNALDTAAAVIEVGLHHEQQHQELMLTDLKHMFAQNPLHPAYAEPAPSSSQVAAGQVSGRKAIPFKWLEFEGGIRKLGNSGSGFSYDNERPEHETLLHPFRLANRLVTCGDYLDFMEDGGYERSDLWLSEGWHHVQEEKWHAPLYWESRDDGWQEFTLLGMLPVDRMRPVAHVSYFEADAYARWAGTRLPNEAEWETVARSLPVEGNFVEQQTWRPGAAIPAENDSSLPLQMYGDLWEWTASPYTAYPGFEPENGALGEYNGKFMCNQFVLRGGSCVSSQTHIRPTYRNFFAPASRWQFAGIRLAE